MTAPNIILLMSDQHRADVMGCAGDPVAITPNMDRLANEGVRFSRANTQGPLCMPGRASFATERWVRDHGVFDNYHELEPGTPTFLHGLKEAGYHTAEIGKMHLWMHSQHQGKTSWEMEPILHSFGFDESIETLGKHASLKRDNPYSAHLRSKGLLEGYQDVLNAKDFIKHSGQQEIASWDTTPCDMSLDDYVDGWHGAQTVDWITNYDRDEPFFLWVGWPGPHEPFDAPEEARRWYDGIEMTEPGSTAAPDPTHTANYAGLIDLMQRLGNSDTLTPDRVRDLRVAYYAAVTLIDKTIGNIIGALDATGQLDNTWIIYTSDHGEMLGDHNLLMKCEFYDPSIKVPVIVRPPGGTDAKVIDDLVEQIDLSATIRAIADAPAPPQSEARSLMGYVDGEAPDPRPVSITENWGFAAFETATHKLVMDEDTSTPVQLFDLREDAVEDHNLVADPQAADVIGTIVEEHAREFLAVPAFRPHRSMFSTTRQTD